jgi:hypothetical protein
MIKMIRQLFVLVALVVLANANPVHEIFREGRIVGGFGASAGQFPYQVCAVSEGY